VAATLPRLAGAFLLLGGMAAALRAQDLRDEREGRVEILSREGITDGCAANRFCPGKTSTRGEMAAFLARAFSLP
jgi:hypothetical protein